MRNMDKLYEIVYKSYEILTKNPENIDLDSILDLAFDYLDLKLLWIGIFRQGKLDISKAKGEAIDYINDESLRDSQQNILKSYLDKVFVSNDVLSDERLSYLKDKALAFGFNSIFSVCFKINDDDYGFIVFYAKEKNYFDRRTQEILTNFSNAIKTAVLFEEKEKQRFMLSKIIEDSYQGVVITDSENKIIYANNAFTQITGYTFEEAKGKNPSILKSGYHSKDFYIDMWRQIAHNGYFNGKIYNKRKNGEIYEELIFIKAIKDKNGNIANYFSFFVDLTELKKLKKRQNTISITTQPQSL